MALPRPQHPLTCDDLLALPDDGKRFEIIDGELYETPAPGSIHQIVLMNLVLLLAPVIRMLGGRALASPIDVFMSHADPVRPDFVALLPGGAARVSARGVEGPPDLVIEVLSTSSATHDNARKRDLYGRAGVGEFWIVDLAARSVAVLAHGHAGLRPTLAFAGDDNLVSPLLPGAAFPLAAIFADLDGIQD